MKKLFKLAAQIAKRNSDGRNYILGAACLRNDGKVVLCANIPNSDKNHKCHAETRVSRMADKGSEVYVVRLTKNTNQYMNSKPCIGCQNSMRARGVKKVYYTISNTEYGVMEL